MSTWESRLRDIADGVVVNKGASVKFDGLKLPRFVSEFALAQFAQDSSSIAEAMEKMNRYCAKYIPMPGHADEWRYRVQQGDECVVIDRLSVTSNLEKKDKLPQGSIPSLGISRARILPKILDDNPRLLRGGIWGKCAVAADDDEYWIQSFEPFQVSDVNVRDYQTLRKEFSAEEWLEILVSTIGLSVVRYPSRRLQMILVARLLPLVESQVYLIEMGTPGTGKTFVLDKLSTRSFVVSGSKISAPQLFYNIRTRGDGLLRNYSALLLDEIDKVKDSDLDDEVVNKLLKFMESGTFDRGGAEFQSSASIVMVGNIPQSALAGNAVLAGLPQKLKHEAFLDRISGLLPGWELSPVGHADESLTSTWGFGADYFSEVLEVLRNLDWIERLRPFIRFDNCSMRDEKAILRIVSGLAKLVYPDTSLNRDDLAELLSFAVEMRSHVIEESALIQGLRPRRIAAEVASSQSAMHLK